MTEKKNHYLLLTATIVPKPNQTSLVMINPEARLAEYTASLYFYAAQLGKGVVDGLIFAENSAYDLTALKAMFPQPAIEWISCYGLDYEQSFHRGYGEFRLLDFVAENSHLLKSAKATDAVWKVSGRYILKNLRTVVCQAPQSFDLYIETDQKWSEMSVMAWSVQGFIQYLRPVWPSFASGMAPELILAKEINRLKSESNLIVTQTQWPTYLIGKRGTDGQSYQVRWGLLRHFLKIFQVRIALLRSKS